MEDNKGQHFLLNEDILKEIVKASELRKNDRVLEVGAGSGNLTEHLVKRASEVTAFELDKKLGPLLKKKFASRRNITLIIDDALKYYWKNFDKIVSNIPYYISEPLIIKAIIADIRSITIVIGEKFKNKLLSHNKIGLIANSFYEINVIRKIDRKEFTPQPRVNSFLVTLKKKTKISKIDKIMLDISIGKGKIKNSIIHALMKSQMTKREAKSIVAKIDIHDSILEKPALKITSKLFLRIKSSLEDVL